MSRIRAEVEIDEDLLRWAEQRAEREGSSRDAVLEDAVRRGRLRRGGLVELAATVWQDSELTGEQAMAMAVEEVDAARTERRAQPGDGPPA